MSQFYTMFLVAFLLLYTPTLAVVVNEEKKTHNIRSRHREVTVCDQLKACYLVNLQTRKETRLVPSRSSTTTSRTGSSSSTDNSTTVIFDPTNTLGYSIRCDIVDTRVGESDFIKFFYDNIVHDEFDSIRYMNGDSHNGRYINPVPYLSTCGKKSVRIEGHVWSNKCFQAVYQINLVCNTNTDTNCRTQLDRFELVDTIRRRDIMKLTDYSARTMASKNVTIRAVPKSSSLSCIDSVRFELDGVVIRCEKHSPYALHGDPSTTNIDPNNALYNYRPISIGRHTITATPYKSQQCTGTPGSSLSSTFTVSE